MKMTLRDWRAVIAVLLLPVLATALTLWSMENRTLNFDNVPAAIVNLDEGAKMVVDGKEMTVPLGRELSAGLMYPEKKFDVNLDWQIVTEETAKKGLEDGDFEAVLTIPKNFSKNVTSIGSVEATPALITITSNDASSELMGIISSQIAYVAANKMGSGMTEQMLNGVYLGFNEMKDQLGTAADGAKQLDDGARQLGDGVGQLSGGVSELADGVDQLAGGASALANGTRELASGSDQLYGGVAQLSGGASQLANGLQQFRDGFVGTPSKPGLKTGIDQLNQGINGPDGMISQYNMYKGKIEEILPKLHALLDALETLQKDLDGVLPEDWPDLDELEQQINDLEAKLKEIDVPIGEARETICGTGTTDCSGGLVGELTYAIEQCDAEATPQLCQSLIDIRDGLQQTMLSFPDDADTASLYQTINNVLGVITGLDIDKINQDIDSIKAAIDALNDQLGIDPGELTLEDLQAKLSELESTLEELDTGVTQLSSGVEQLAGGAAQLQAGLDGTPNQQGLVGGALALSNGTQQLLPGVKQLNDGTWALSSGADELASGTGRLAGGARELAGGTGELYAGIQELIKGTTRFATELKDGAEQVPSYTDAERTKIVKMGAMPVISEASRLHEADSGANSTFPWAAGIVLWIGAFGTFLVMPGLRKRELASSDKPLRVAWKSFRPAALLALIQAIGVGAIATLIGVSPNDLFTTTMLMIVGTLSFAAINQAMLAVAGARVGRILALLFLVVQVVSLGGIIPIETAPAAFQALSDFLPLSYLTNGLMHTVFGGRITSFMASVIPLIIWGLVAFIFTVIAAGKARQMDVEEVRMRYAA